MAQPDLLRHFSQLFCGEHDYLITLPQPQRPHDFITIHCNAFKMHQKCNVKSDTKQCSFGVF